MTMAADARKEVSEWPTTSKRRCREGARKGRGTQFFFDKERVRACE